MTRLSSNNILGTLGPKFSFHDILIKEKFDDPEIQYFHSFEDIFKALQKNQIQAALVAIKNSIHGEIEKNAKMISSQKLKVIKSFDLPISLDLAAKKSIKLADVKKIYAYTAAWNECQHFLGNYGIEHIYSSSNSQALIDLKNSTEAHIAAISGREAINKSGLKLIYKDIHDREPNITTFSLVAKK
jgi:prephenate dehydratase